MFAQEHAPTHLCSQRPQPGPNTLEDIGGERRALCKAHSGNTWEENILQKGEREGRDEVGKREREEEGEETEVPRVGSGP